VAAADVQSLLVIAPAERRGSCDSSAKEKAPQFRRSIEYLRPNASQSFPQLSPKRCPPNTLNYRIVGHWLWRKTKKLGPDLGLTMASRGPGVKRSYSLKIRAQDQTLPFEPGIKKAEIQMSLGPRNAANGGSIRRPGKTEVLPRLNAGRSLDLGEEGRPAPAYQINRRLK
jgi:hypothetical protein